MPVQELVSGQSLGLDRGEAAVCIPVYGGYDLFAQCLRSVLAHTDPDVAILACDDASVDPRIRTFVHETLAQGQWPNAVYYLRQPENVGFVKNVNAGFAALAPADVVILNSDCVVTEGWLEGLRAAVESDSRVATATALTNAGTIVSVPQRNQPMPALPQDTTIDGIAATIRARSHRLRPDLPTCIGHCVYIRRMAIDLVGDFDLAFSPGYEEEVDFSQRCLVHGLRHVLADDVFVFHRHSGSFGRSEKMEQLRFDHHRIIADRYAYFDEWIAEVREDPFSPLAHSITQASGAVQGLSVTIDGRCLTRFMTGTSLATLELLAALDLHTKVHLRVLIPDDLGSYAADVLSKRPDIELLRMEDMEGDGPGLTDVAHRPYQAQTFQDPLLLRRLGYRVVMTQLDNIAMRNPAYFGEYREWRNYRRVNIAALAAADQVVFISRHGADDARALELVSEQRVNVIPLATDHTLPELYPELATRPAGLPEGQAEFLLCLGTDFLHKNRLFAIRLLEALLSRGRFDGRLLFAGPKVSEGSSAGEEAAYLSARPQLAERVSDLGAVGEQEKTWLLTEARAVVYPTTYEGFGLVPFEAARMGTPCLFAWHTALADQLPPNLGRLVPWDAEASAANSEPVLNSGTERQRLVDGVRMAGARLTSARNAQRHAEVYERAMSGPAPTAGVLAAEVLRLQTELDEIYGDPLNRGLAGRYAVLPRELRRPVLAIATRPALRGTVSALYRAAYRVRNGSRQNSGEKVRKR